MWFRSYSCLASQRMLCTNITNIVNLSLSSGNFHHTLKESVISPLLKKPILDKDELSNYRPISNLSLISKIIERVVKSRLSDCHIQRWARPARCKWLQFYFSDLKSYPLSNRGSSIIQATRENNSCSIKIKCIILKCKYQRKIEIKLKIININNNKERKDNIHNSDVSGLT